MKKTHCLLAALLFLCILFLASGLTDKASAQEAEPVAHAVLFYSPSCSHCHEIIQEYLPTLFEQFGKQLEIMRIDISDQVGQDLYFAAVQKFSISDDRLGVPTLLIGNTVLVGSTEIPEQLPELVQEFLSGNGVGWPDIPGLDAVLGLNSDAEETPSRTPKASSDLPIVTNFAQPMAPVGTKVSPNVISATPELASSFVDDGKFDWKEKFLHGASGSTLAIFVLIAMLVSFPGAIVLYHSYDVNSYPRYWTWLFPFFCVLGFGIASYLSYVELTLVSAVCGPIGDCNAVQQSEYARLFGILPVGVLGIIGYIAILFSWGFIRYADGVLAKFAAMSLLAMTSTGTLFSVYLTFLELFVIDAVCIWCITSAIIMTMLLLLSVYPTKFVLLNLSSTNKIKEEA